MIIIFLTITHYTPELADGIMNGILDLPHCI
jgi:hypothetical protein